MSGVSLHHLHWTARMVGRRQAWYDITALEQHTRSNDVGHGRREWHLITALGQHSRSNYVERGMTSPPLDNTHGRTTSGVA